MVDDHVPLPRLETIDDVIDHQKEIAEAFAVEVLGIFNLHRLLSSGTDVSICFAEGEAGNLTGVLVEPERYRHLCGKSRGLSGEVGEYRCSHSLRQRGITIRHASRGGEHHIE